MLAQIVSTQQVHLCVGCYCTALEHRWNSFEDMLLMNRIKWLSRNSSFIYPSSTTYKLQNFRVFSHSHTHAAAAAASFLFICTFVGANKIAALSYISL